MPPDRSFRSRLREVLQQSAVGRPAHDPAAGRAEGGRREAEDTAAAGVRELRYETEGERDERADVRQAAWIADALGGWWQRDERGACLVVDRVYPGDRAHGDSEIGAYAETLARYRAALHNFDRRSVSSDDTLFAMLTQNSGPRTPDDDDRLLFFDLETTGLSGGAGICAFLIGYGWFDGDCFRTRQYFLGGYAHEAAMLHMAAEPLSRITLASFNGKTFDVPLITGRYLFHRVTSPFDAVRHIDVLHPARRLWRHRPSEGAEMPPSASRLPPDRRDAFTRYFRATAIRDDARSRRHHLSANAASCALGALEEAVLGFRRTGDIPGGEIPSRYFHYARSGDVRPLAPVLEHNRLDLVSLAAVASVVARMLEEGPDAARNGHECLALGRLYERSGATDRATVCYQRAAEGSDTATWRRDPIVEREALRHLAMRYRREQRHEDAAAAWQRLLDLAADGAGLDFEALHALAVHHEHRSKDLLAARALVVRALDGTSNARLGEQLRHRLARIDRKLAGLS